MRFHERLERGGQEEIMKNFKRALMALAMGLIVSFGALAEDQKKGEDKPPPKETAPKVRNEDKKDKPPSNNNGNQGGGKKDDKKGKP
jgi:hypothetical protein